MRSVGYSELLCLSKSDLMEVSFCFCLLNIIWYVMLFILYATKPFP